MRSVEGKEKWERKETRDDIKKGKNKDLRRHEKSWRQKKRKDISAVYVFFCVVICWNIQSTWYKLSLY